MSTKSLQPSGANRRGLLRRALITASLLFSVALSGAVAPAAVAATIPIAPSGLAISVVAGDPSLVWADNSSDETGFEIERCLVVGGVCGFQPLATNPANLYLFIDTGAGTQAYNYRVRAVNSAGASNWTTAAVVPSGLSLARPVAVLSVTPTTGVAPLASTFIGSGSYGLDFSVLSNWSWSFGDGATANTVNATHTYTTPGSYRVTLTVTDTAGRTSLAETRVTVNPPPANVVAPASLTATGLLRKIRLNWTNAPNTTTTQLWIQRCRGSSCTVFNRVAILSPTAITWTDTAVVRGATYRYMVTAIDVPAGVSASAGPVQAKVK
ncbi:MAG: PKD domain-containing protein [Nocardioides sp.]